MQRVPLPLNNCSSVKKKISHVFNYNCCIKIKKFQFQNKFSIAKTDVYNLLFKCYWIPSTQMSSSRMPILTECLWIECLYELNANEPNAYDLHAYEMNAYINWMSWTEYLYINWMPKRMPIRLTKCWILKYYFLPFTKKSSDDQYLKVQDFFQRSV